MTPSVVRHVAGDPNGPDAYARTPIKTTEIGLGPDAQGRAGRLGVARRTAATQDQKSIWHNYKGRSRFNMLFVDGHVRILSVSRQAEGLDV
jgi:prepilin-type processing-associated H-X9-DG protein